MVLCEQCGTWTRWVSHSLYPPYAPKQAAKKPQKKRRPNGAPEFFARESYHGEYTPDSGGTLSEPSAMLKLSGQSSFIG